MAQKSGNLGKTIKFHQKKQKIRKKFKFFKDMALQSFGSLIKEPRFVVRKFLARPQHEGLGAVVRRSIGR